MKRLVGLLVAVAILCAGLLFGGTQAFAQNYAIVTTKMMPKKKYYATEFGYRKMNNDVIVYYERPENGRIFQGKDDLKISTKIGSVKFDSFREVWIDKENTPKSLLLVYTIHNNISIEGNFIIRDKRNRVITNPNMDYMYIDFAPSGTMMTVGSLVKKPLSMDRKNVTITTMSGAIISVDGNSIYLKKKNYTLSFQFDLEREEAYCFVH